MPEEIKPQDAPEAAPKPDVEPKTPETAPETPAAPPESDFDAAGILRQVGELISKKPETAAPAAPAPSTLVLSAERQDHLRKVVETYGDEYANAIVKPVLEDAQRQEDRLAPTLKAMEQMQQAMAAETRSRAQVFIAKLPGHERIYGRDWNGSENQKTQRSALLGKVNSLLEQLPSLTPDQAFGLAHIDMHREAPEVSSLMKKQATASKIESNITIQPGAQRGGGPQPTNDNWRERVAQKLREKGYAK